MEINCINCGKKTEAMFKMNKGLYCDNCKELGLIIQKQTMSAESFKDRMKSYRNLTKQ